jgi:hypothetical protein
VCGTLHLLIEGLTQVESPLGGFKRSSPYLQSPIFNLYHSEHEMLRYLKRLENRWGHYCCLSARHMPCGIFRRHADIALHGLHTSTAHRHPVQGLHNVLAGVLCPSCGCHACHF